jgi:cytochrome P450
MSDKRMSDKLDDDTRHWSCYTTSPERSLEIFEQARGRCPLAQSEEHDSFYMLLNYRDVRGAMADHRTYSSEPQVLRPMLPRKPIPALDMDPPRHGPWRAIFAGAITAKTPEAMQPFVREDIDRHIDEFIERGHCDIVAELAEPVPAETICRLVGVDDALVPQVRKAALAMFAAQGDPEEFARRQGAFAALTVGEVHARRSQPREDYLTHLSTLEVEGRALDDGDYVGLMAAFLGAGHHSTTSAMASLIYEVFSRPSLRDSLREDPAKIIIAVEEALRLHPPFFGFFRRTTRPVQVAGTDIPAHCDVYMGWAAANRDPSVFEQPVDFRLDRPHERHLTFGFGIHTCPGAGLARMELRVLLEQLLLRLPDLHIEEARPQYQFGGGDYAFLSRLKVGFTPRPRLRRDGDQEAGAAAVSRARSHTEPI